MDELQHYGVKGMRWGVRKSRTPAEKALRKQQKIEAKKIHRESDILKKQSTRRTMADKYRPYGISGRGRVQIKRRGVAGHLPIVGRPKTLSKKKTQRLVDEMSLNLNVDRAFKDKYTRSLIADEILRSMATYRARDVLEEYRKG